MKSFLFFTVLAVAVADLLLMSLRWALHANAKRNRPR